MIESFCWIDRQWQRALENGIAHSQSELLNRAMWKLCGNALQQPSRPYHKMTACLCNVCVHIYVMRVLQRPAMVHDNTY